MDESEAREIRRRLTIEYCGKCPLRMGCSIKVYECDTVIKMIREDMHEHTSGDEEVM